MSTSSPKLKPPSMDAKLDVPPPPHPASPAFAQLVEQVRDPDSHPQAKEEQSSLVKDLWRLFRSEHNVHSIEEARFLIRSRGGFAGAQDMISKQLDIIVTRSSNILSLTCIILTITGFSGPSMARTNTLTKVMMALGLIFCTSSAAIVMIGSFNVRWATQIACWARDTASRNNSEIDQSGLEVLSVSETIRYRNRKHLMFNIELAVIVLGLLFYLGAFLLYLIG